ncbi:PilW family protein [Halomonas alimentaria]|uniref:Prepilin-type N-terminal cleavage/methylation domain-containing protein n=1 Tax=Halomonas alimentaria TaxID=147248 RepID=A0A7X5APD2_9GAMM|nr:PilW family protein [Halomonas alimentaria]NAW33272.1 prepilin-type N-terminal cleavage/methylation domain-containing protein [Halomonas alimentaria]
MRHSLRTAGPRQQRGVSLIELMIAMIIGLVVTGALLAMFGGMQRNYRLAEASSTLQEDARYAAEVFSSSLRAAGYTGCGGGEDGEIFRDDDDDNIQSLATRLVNGEVIQQTDDDSFSLLSPSSASYRVTGVNSDSLTMELGNDDPQLNWRNGNVVLVNDCNNMALVEIGEDFTLSASASGSVDVNAEGLDSLEVATNSPAIAVRVEEREFRLDGDGVLRFNGSPTFSGIESIQLLYGISDDAQSVDRFVRHGSLGNEEILAVRFELLLRSENDVLASPGEQAYFFDGAMRQANDRRLRYAIGGTVWLRNH